MNSCSFSVLSMKNIIDIIDIIEKKFAKKKFTKKKNQTHIVKYTCAYL